MIRGRSREALFLLVILPFWSNSLVRVFSWAIVLRGNGVLDWLASALVPGEVRLDLAYSETAVVIGLVHSYLPYVILTGYLALQAIDDSLIEAARSLGARRRTILWRIVLPLAAPGLIAGAVLVFVPVVGSFMEPRLLGGRVGTTYGTVIEDQFVAVFNWPLRGGAVVHPAGGRAGHSGRGGPRPAEGPDMSAPAVLGRLYLGLILIFLYAPSG